MMQMCLLACLHPCTLSPKAYLGHRCRLACIHVQPLLLFRAALLLLLWAARKDGFHIKISVAWQLQANL